ADRRWSRAMDTTPPWPPSGLSQHDEVGQLRETDRPVAEMRERPMGLVAQTERERPRLLQAHQRDVRGLVRLAVLARGLAQGRAVTLDIEHVVDDLEGEPDRAGVGIKRLRARFVPRRCGSGHPAEAYRRAQQRPGLAPVHAFERFAIEPQADGPDVDRLATHHA